jgi:hypothetical protein
VPQKDVQVFVLDQASDLIHDSILKLVYLLKVHREAEFLP